MAFRAYGGLRPIAYLAWRCGGYWLLNVLSGESPIPFAVGEDLPVEFAALFLQHLFHLCTSYVEAPELQDCE